MKTESIVLGGGCFWCTEAVFQKMKGVLKVTSGYSGGSTPNPTYEQVCSGNTGHAEVVRVEYDPSVAKLPDILELFFALHDPTTKDRQGNDVGSQYRSAIYYSNESQKKAIDEAVRKAAEEHEKPIVTEVAKLDAFYPAEDYHQNYYEQNKYQPYCAVVIRPKLSKLKKKFGLL